MTDSAALPVVDEAIPELPKLLDRRKKDRLKGIALAMPGAVWLFVFAVLPLGFLILLSFWTSSLFGLSTTFTFDNYRSIASSSGYLTVLWHTLMISAATTILALIISYPMALFLADLKGNRKTIAVVLLFMPFWTSYLVRTFLWLPMLGRTGLVNQILISLGLVDTPVDWLLYNEGAVLLGLIYVYTLYMTLPIYLSLDKLDPKLLEAAADLGAGPLQILWRILLPLTLPGILSGSIMVFLLACGAYVTPQLLGGTKGVMFGSIIAAQYLQTNNWALGAALSVVLVAVVFLCLFAVGRRVRLNEVFLGVRD
jgi:spermidine/putrescine transport system permease protein